jgi:hypothetical protein
MFDRLQAVAFSPAYAALRECFELEHGDPGRDLVAHLTGRSVAEIARAVSALAAPRTEEVLVLWPGEERAVRMGVGDLVDGFAELWSPGSDDLLIADPSRRWIVLLDHEAQLWFLDA